MKNRSCELYARALSEAKKEAFDLKKIAALLEKSQRLGGGKAANALANWYIHGKYFEKNYKKAVSYLKISVDRGVPEAMFTLALCYEKGKGTKINCRKAFECYLRAALFGDDQSIFEVGRCYYYGIGVTKDKQIADIWFSKAEAVGVYDAKGS